MYTRPLPITGLQTSIPMDQVAREHVCLVQVKQVNPDKTPRHNLHVVPQAQGEGHPHGGCVIEVLIMGPQLGDADTIKAEIQRCSVSSSHTRRVYSQAVDPRLPAREPPRAYIVGPTGVI